MIPEIYLKIRTKKALDNDYYSVDDMKKMLDNYEKK